MNRRRKSPGGDAHRALKRSPDPAAYAAGSASEPTMRSMLAFFAGAVFAGAGLAQDATLIANPKAFATLVNPNCSHCVDEAKRRAGELRDDDRVLCWLRGYSDGGVIPHRFFLNPYRVISDTYGVFVYDA